MGIGSKNFCDRKEVIDQVKRLLDEMGNARVEARCCCTDPDNPPSGSKVVSVACLDGKPGLPTVVADNKGRYIWKPPPVDNRPLLDPTMSCYAATVANQFYDQWKGCRLECKGPGVPTDPHSHWWNEPRGVQGGGSAPSAAQRHPDYCEDPSFVPPEPAGHQAWTHEPGGTCRYPQYCKAACFDHYPERDWGR